MHIQFELTKNYCKLARKLGYEPFYIDESGKFSVLIEEVDALNFIRDMTNAMDDTR